MIYTPSQMYQWFLSLYSDHGFLSKLQTHTSKLLRIIFAWITELFQIQYTQTHYSALSLPFSVSLSFTLTFDNASPWNKGEPCSSSAFCFLILILSISLHSIPVVINFMCWLGWDIVPRYVVKCYFGCFWDSIFWKILTFKFVPFESSGLSSIHGWASNFNVKK